MNGKPKMAQGMLKMKYMLGKQNDIICVKVK